MFRATRWIHLHIAILIGFLGASALLSSYFRAFHVTGNLVHIAHVSTFTLGFLLLYLAVQLYKRKRIAFWASIIVLALLIGLNTIHGHHLWRIIFYLGSLLLLIKYKSVFNVKSDNVSLVNGLRVAVVVIVCALLYGIGGFYFLHDSAFGQDFTLSQAAVNATLQIISFQNFVTPHTQEARFFMDSLDLVSITAFFIALGALFRPVRFILSVGHADRGDAKRIIAASSRSVEDFFKLWPEDKHYFFNEKHTSVVAYKVSQGAALILDGPSGDPRTFYELLKGFMAFASTNGWVPAIIHCDKETVDVSRAAGMKPLFIGNEAIIDVNTFAESTHHNKHFRYAHNKAMREGLSFAVWQPPLSDEQIGMLKRVSDSWMRMPGRREYTFIMGYFDEEYLRKCHVAVLARGGEVIAYTNLIPSYIPSVRSIDHMRHTADMPSTGMHYLLKELILYLHTEGVKSFNLGLAPLSGVEQRTDVSDRILSVVKRLGSRMYSFVGLEQFKNKFQPLWEPRYITYTGGPTALLAISNSLNSATSLPVSNRRTRLLVAACAVVAGLCYISFLLARPLGLPDSGLVSELGARGKEYAWLFNGLDVLSGLLVLFVAAQGLRSASKNDELWRRWMLGAYGLAGFGSMLAALAPLPATYTLAHGLHWPGMAIFTHGVFSALNVGSLYVAIVLFVMVLKRRRRLWVILAGATIVIGIASLMRASSPTDGALQHIQLVTMGIWMIVIGLAAVPRAVTAEMQTNNIFHPTI